MRTYEVTMRVIRYETVLVEVESPEQVKPEAYAKTVLAENENADVFSLVDVTPKPPTDKERFNAAFKELRRLGYKARQNLTPYDDGPEVYTMREDVVDAFRGGELTGMMPLHWDYVNHENTVFHNQRVKILTSVFEDHGFSVEWEGRFYNALEIRKGVEA